MSTGQAWFHLAGSGHAGSAALAPFLSQQDWLFAHYRSKALLVARGAEPEQFFLGFFGKEQSQSAGRLLGEHFSDPERHNFCTAGPVGNSSLHAVGVAAAVRDDNDNPIVVCGMGDGTTQQGEVLEAISEAIRSNLPVLFLVEDNGYAISTRTRGRTFYSLPDGEATEFLGVNIRRCKGTDIPGCLATFSDVVSQMRAQRGPAIVVMQCERMASHSNADDQCAYRSPQELDATAHADPLACYEQTLEGMGVARNELLEIRRAAETQATEAAHFALEGADPPPCLAILDPAPPALQSHGAPKRERCTLAEAIRGTLERRLAASADTFLHGQDIEDPKGDVFGITRGLSTRFPGRVANAPLSESTIIGMAIGRALTGQRPVAMLQFADFLPLALNQVLLELAMLRWRTNNRITAPVIIMAPCGAYREGLGPYHAQTFDSLLAHTPGLVVAVPSNAEDAAGLLNSAFTSRDPVAFLYPKSLLNEESAARDLDLSVAVPFGKARTLATGSDLTIVSWGSTIPYCSEAAAQLRTHGFSIDLLDLRTLAPWDKAAVIDSYRRTRRLLVVHEDNLTGGFGAEIVASVTEALGSGLAARRVARPDVHVPYHPACQEALLPSTASILEAASLLLGLEAPRAAAVEEERPGVIVVRAFRASPSDSSFALLSLRVACGDIVNEGDVLGEYETEKTTADFAAPVTGIVDRICAHAGDRLEIGAPILEIRTQATRPVSIAARVTPDAVACSTICVARGGRLVTNDDIISTHPGKTTGDIERLSGIASRSWVSEDQDSVSLATDAASQLLDLAGADSIARIGMVLVCTASIDDVSPSTACRVVGRLADRGIKLPDAPAFDISAACAGYVYGLALAHDHVTANPDKLVLLITTEMLSPLIDPNDFSTRILFGDAATATMVGTHEAVPQALFTFSRPIIRSRPDRKGVLSAPPLHTGRYLHMEGQRVFREAVRCMSAVSREACHAAGQEVSDVDLLVPHQANLRIVEALTGVLGVPTERVATNIATTGNTSSSSIPLLLNELAAGNNVASGARLCLCAFGAGFTYGAALARWV